jgi:DNA polymerase I-like protein with 3'-5' exonuclease and polymerase domains
VDLPSIRTFVDRYFLEFSDIFRLRQAVVGKAKGKKQLRTKIGRVIHLADDVTDNSLLNWPVQANGADAFKLALYLISGRLEGMHARIVHTLHDEIITEVRDGIKDQVQEIVEESMEETFKEIIPEVPFAVEIRGGRFVERARFETRCRSSPRE